MDDNDKRRLLGELHYAYVRRNPHFLLAEELEWLWEQRIRDLWAHWQDNDSPQSEMTFGVHK